MPVSLVQIDVDDARFQKFQDLFNKYKDALQKTPEMWARATKEQRVLAVNFERMSAAMLAIGQLDRDHNEALQRSNEALTRGATQWDKIAHSSRETNHNVAGIGLSLLKWGGAIAGVLGITGILGSIVSLLNADKLAHGMAGIRRTALGYHTSSGFPEAFQQSYSRFLDTDSFLSNINSMETDVTQRAPALALGVNFSGDFKKDTMAVLEAVRQKARNTPEGLLAPIINRGYGFNFGADELHTLKYGDEKEFKELANKTDKNTQILNMQDQMLKRWTDLAQTFDTWESRLRNATVKGLDPFVGTITKTGERMVKFYEDLGNSGKLHDAFEKLAAAVEDLTGKIQRILGFFGGLSWGDADPLKQADKGAANIWNSLKGGGSAVSNWLKHAGYGGEIDLASAKAGLPNGLMRAIWKQESSEGVDGVPDSSKGAIGPFQMMQSNARGLNLRDPDQNLVAATQLLSDLDRHYKEDIVAMAAAYSWGAGNLDALQARDPNWNRHLPAQVATYVNGVTANMGLGVRVEVNNNTGGSAHASVSQLGPVAAQ